MDILSLNQKIPYDAAKWQKMQVLLEASEFASLLDLAGGVLFDRLEEISHERAKKEYSDYVTALREGRVPSPPSFAWSWSLSLEAFYILDTGNGRQIKVKEPVVQLTHHQMNYTPEENAFRSNLFGPETIYWGLQFAFPQLFMEPVSKEVVKVSDPKRFYNLSLFRQVKSFLREHSLPTPFEGVNAPQRVGKQALSWVANHPHLVKKGLKLKSNRIVK